jgi:hypothetical protein
MYTYIDGWHQFIVVPLFVIHIWLKSILNCRIINASFSVASYCTAMDHVVPLKLKYFSLHSINSLGEIWCTWI